MKMDKDKDKKLSLEEFTEGMKRVHQVLRPQMRPPMHPPMRPPVRPQVRRAGPPAAVAHRAARGKELFKKADKNKDGKLSKEEARGPLKEHFEKIDADGDGQLTPDEIKAAMAKRRAAMKKRAEEKATKAKKKSESEN